MQGCVWLEFLRICVVSNVWVFQYYTLSIGVSKRQIFQCHNKRVHSMPDAKKIGQSSCSSSATLISLGWKTTNVAMNRNALKAAAHLYTALDFCWLWKNPRFPSLMGTEKQEIGKQLPVVGEETLLFFPQSRLTKFQQIKVCLHKSDVR